MRVGNEVGVCFTDRPGVETGAARAVDGLGQGMVSHAAAAAGLGDDGR